MKTIIQTLLLITVSISVLYPQTEMFKSYTVDNGLSSSKINCMLQDRMGFIWFGTGNGLNRFDGSEFKIFRHKQKNQNSVSDNTIWTLLEDGVGNIWIGTKSGILNKYSPVTDRFEQITLNENKLSDNSITAIFEDKDGIIWVGTYAQGLFRYESNSGKLTNWKYDSAKQNGLSNNYISSIIQDVNGFIWISTYNGLNKFNPEKLNDGFVTYYSDKSDENSLSNNLIWNIAQSKINKNQLWIGTVNGICSVDINTQKFSRLLVSAKYPMQFSNSFGTIVEQKINDNIILWAASYGGLFKIDLSNNNIEQFIVDKKNPNGLLGNQIDQIMEDRSGVLWIVVKDKGLNYLSLKAQKFNSIFSKITNSPLSQELLHVDVKSIVKGNDNNYYFAASEGLYQLKIEKQKPAVLKKFDKLNNLNLWSVEKGSDNDLWIGTYGNGLIHFDLKDEKIQYKQIKSPTFKTSAFDYVKSLHLNKEGKLWIGFWGGGLTLYDTKSNNYKIWIRGNDDNNSLNHNDVWALHEDNLGRLWIGTNGGGLNLYNPNNNGTFKYFEYDPSDSNSLINNSVISIDEIQTNDNSKTILLIGTENGLSELTIKNNLNDIYNFKLDYNNFNDVENLSDLSISAVIKNSKGDFWISSNSGLFRYNTESQSFAKFGSSEGLNSSIFNSDAFCESKDGIIMFGSAKGPVIFNPSEIVRSDYQPQILITDFLIFNKSIIPNEDSPLKENITFAKKINLNYDQNTFTLKFSSTDYNPSEQIHFKYKLEGFDADWIDGNSNRTVNYTNINPGRYRFAVKGSNSDGKWSEQEASVDLIISPPYWKTFWAYCLYIILILLGVYTIRRFEISRAKLKNELKLIELEAAKVREIEIMKSRFFTNLSHEFRTPLMLINGPIEQLLMGNKVNQTEQIKLIKRNSEKLQNLIDQLLELSQLEAAAIELKAKKVNLVPIVRGILYSFSSLAERKNIALSFYSDKKEITAWIDRDKIEKVLNNILSNAFKFTPDKGKINIELINTSIDNIDYTTISIKDSGIGIAPEKVNKIFDRFYQVDDSSKRAFSGSGIGLSLVKELVDLHRWKITVNSKPNFGTEFIIQIPLNENYLNQSQKVYDEKQLIEEGIKESSFITDVEQLESEIDETHKPNKTVNKNLKLQKKPTLLIVEDSEDVRIYLKDILKEEYEIILSENGEAGLKTALESLPDLIISDIMMPIMDGIEFCKNIKSDWQTAHIPVILLTAKASAESKIEGLETGADDYITKPFSYKELSVRIKNLLQQRKQLKEKYAKDVAFKPEDITPNKADQEFLQQAIEIVGKNIIDFDFDSDSFAQQMFVSRSQLHRKIRTISGQSTGEFIRTIRLKKAAGLILEKKLSVTQVALEVGFNSPSHFTKAFKQMFDCLPSDFVEKSHI